MNISLQSNDTRNLLDVIIVCGEQSSGKSLVFKAVSGVRFPSKDNLCTKFVTELILRRGPSAPIKIRIVPGSQKNRLESDLKKLLNFHVSVSAGDLQLGEIIESAKDAIGINDSNSETVKSLILSYMQSPRSIILAVVSAKNDFNNQLITKYSRQIDPNGVRTLRLITKPDTLDEGSDSKRFYIKLAQNKDVRFRLGWHVLRVWKSLPPNQVRVHNCTKRLDELGVLRATAQSFNTLRLRAVLQNTLTEFVTIMRKEGHTHTIINEGPTELPHHISRSDYVAKVTKLLERSRGRELPGTFDPLIVGQLFHKQREPWAKLVDKYLEIILRAVYFLARTALAHVCDKSTLAGLSRRFIYIRLERLAAELRNKVTELLRPHDTGHLITYNHYLTENRHQHPYHVNTLINTLVLKTEADMNNYASSTATDFMEAYYKVAMKKIIDDFSVLAVEARLVQELPSLFCPADVIDIDDTTVAALASESEESLTERTLYREKLKILEDRLRALQNIQDFLSAL
ncbi:hypothetical protein K469DRAFT_725843 [Zopfia rhizophila CBS 207.26]|uniref:GED domain-containing protein n=1 Tax=Zopfia rhizophila CBS 207.26 TaxID=1314779 RepID=A0A6A6EUR9_9PEZI|nr:hypothetical protein K469DRAFT_725843 [Zopfia rhizophila CBS 207.26]